MAGLDLDVQTRHVGGMKANHLLYSDTPVDWQISSEYVDYPSAVKRMEERARMIAMGEASELVWLLEHQPLYTAGTSAQASDLIEPDRFPVFKTGRGGQYTYHGPGQRVGYFMLDLKQRGRDVRAYVAALETLIIDTLADLGVDAGRREGRIGVWVNQASGGEVKIAALGVRIRKWVSYHGISINLNPDLSHFDGIVPCGISEHSVTCLHSLDVKISMEDLDAALQANFIKLFGPIESH